MKVNTKVADIREARAHFAELLAAVAKGQRITICKAGTPVAQLGPLDTPVPVRRPGLLKGRVTIAEDFDAPLPPDTLVSFGSGG
jgi:prevent-host-death family protein